MTYRWYKISERVTLSSDTNSVTVQTTIVNNKRICLLQLPEGLFAIDDHCPHAGARLSFGKCNADGIITCPVHRYRYNVKTGKGLQGDYVNTYPVELRDDGLYVGFRKKWWNLF